MQLNVDDIEEVVDSRLLYGFILHYLDMNGDTYKQDLYGKVKRDVKYTFPSLRQDYFHSRIGGSTDFIFTTVFYFAVFHLRDKGYGLIKQTVKKSEPLMSLSSIGKEFLKTPEGQEIFIDYQDIETFLRLRHKKILEKNANNIESYQQQMNQKFSEAKVVKPKNPHGIFHFKPLDIVIGLVVVVVIAFIMKHFDVV